jgi:hypothetical protein
VAVKVHKAGADNQSRSIEIFRFAQNDRKGRAQSDSASCLHNLTLGNKQVTNPVYALAGVNYMAAMDKQKDSFVIHCLT